MTESRMRAGRRQALKGAAALLGGAVSLPAIAQSDNFPSRPIRLVVAYPPGNVSDLVARFVADRMMPILGQPVVIDNRGGAGGTIGTEFIARSAPDGYTIGIANAGPLTIAPNLYPNLPTTPCATSRRSGQLRSGRICSLCILPCR